MDSGVQVRWGRLLVDGLRECVRRWEVEFGDSVVGALEEDDVVVRWVWGLGWRGWRSRRSWRLGIHDD